MSTRAVSRATRICDQAITRRAPTNAGATRLRHTSDVRRQRLLLLLLLAGSVVPLVAATAALGSWSPWGRSGHSTSASTPATRTIPDGVLRQADIPRDAVLLEGATTVAELRGLEPGNAARMFARASPDDAVYAVVVYQARSAGTGVSLHPDTFTSRLLLDKHGNELLGISWASGTKPLPTRAFGTRFDVAPE